jgi:hypothetical protein
MVEHTRTLGFRVALVLGLGTLIAAGALSRSGTTVAETGGSAVVAAAALVAGITASSCAELASRDVEYRSGYLSGSRTFGRDTLEHAVGVSPFLGYTGTTAPYLATTDEWFSDPVVPEWLSLSHGSVGVPAAVLFGVRDARRTEESGTCRLLVSRRVGTRDGDGVRGGNANGLPHVRTARCIPTVA